MPCKVFCHYCLKTIRCNTQPVKCELCFLPFHKKCAKIIDDKFNYRRTKTPKLKCVNCSWCFPFNDLSDEEFKNEVTVKPHESLLNATKLNHLFSQDSILDDNDAENCESTFRNNVVEQYVEITDTDFLSFGDDDQGLLSAICVNIRSLANAINFCKLEAFINSLYSKPDIIAITETWIQPGITGPFNNLTGSNFCIKLQKTEKRWWCWILHKKYFIIFDT